MIRGDLTYDGVVISDDMAGKALTGYSPGQRAIRFLRAGGDLAIMGDVAHAPEHDRRAVGAEAVTTPTSTRSSPPPPPGC